MERRFCELISQGSALVVLLRVHRAPPRLPLTGSLYEETTNVYMLVILGIARGGLARCGKRHWVPCRHCERGVSNSDKG